MRQPDNRQDRDLFDEVFSDRDRAAEAVTYSLVVDGRPVPTTALRVFTETGNPAVGLDGTTPSPLDPRVERKEARVTLRVEGREWLDYRGRVISVGDEGTGTVGASTSGYWQGGEDAVRFGAFAGTPYSHTPSAALSDMLRRLPYRRIRVPDVRAPLFVRQGPDAYPPTAAVGEGIAEVEEEARLVQRDSFLDSARVFPRPSLGGMASGSQGRWRVGREVSSFSATLKNSARWREVDVISPLPDGTYVSLLRDPVPVRYPPGVAPPPVGTTRYEEMPDPSTGNAKDLGLSVAFLLYPGEHDVSMTTPFIDPRIEDFDVREVERLDPETGITTLWRVLIESQERDYAGGTASYRGVGAMLSGNTPWA